MSTLLPQGSLLSIQRTRSNTELPSVPVFHLVQHVTIRTGAGVIESVDSNVHDFFVDNRVGWMVEVAKHFDRYGTSAVILGLAVVVAAIWRARTPTTWLMAAVPMSVIVNEVAVSLLKVMIGRERPPVVQQLVEATSASLPSGHTASATAFVTATVMIRHRMSHRNRSWGLLDLFLSAFAVVSGVARLVLGVHWLSDVVAGWFIGVMIGVLTVRVAGKIFVCRPSTN